MSGTGEGGGPIEAGGPRVEGSGSGGADPGAPAGERAREAIRSWLEAKGHAVENARRALEVLERAQAAGELPRTPVLERMAADLRAALETDDRDRVGAKSAEAARLILRAIVRELERL